MHPPGEASIAELTGAVDMVIISSRMIPRPMPVIPTWQQIESARSRQTGARATSGDTTTVR